MIRHLSPHDPLLRLIVGHGYVAANIGGRAALPQPEYDFWVSDQNGTATAFFCRTGETLYLCGAPSQLEEVTEFALAVGFCHLITDWALPLEQDSPLLAMEYGGALPEIASPSSMQISDCTSESFSSMDFANFQLQSHGLATRQEAEHYAVSLSHELRHGCATVLSAQIDGQLAVGAALSRLYHGTVVLGAVAVLPQYRGRGLGAAISSAACGLAVSRGQLPLLCCTPELCALYTKAGFLPAAPLYCYKPQMKGHLPK
ncbi:MAG: GNAT family N-acetyltransferase [Angelakisella sp.]